MYETNAEYLAEFDRGKLTEQQLANGLALHVRCGEFSFAALPKMFQHILGVTGTLDKERLPPQMHDVLRNEVRAIFPVNGLRSCTSRRVSAGT